MWTEKRINRGERRSVSLDIWLDEGQPLQPETPTWELTEYETGIVETSGVCTVTNPAENGYVLTALIEPKHTGLYRLFFTFGIGSEVRKPCMIIKVK